MNNTLRNDLNSSALVFTAMNKPMKANRKTIDTFLHILSEVKDFRQEGKTVYKLENLLFICFYLSLKGEFTSFKHIADYVQVKQNWFIRQNLIERGKISHAISTYSISVYNVSNGLCLSSAPLADKDSEIKEFQRLLPKFRLENCIVTADALHCQRQPAGARDDIARKIGEIKKPKIIEHNNCEYTILILKDCIGADWSGAKAYVKMVSHKRKDQKDYNPEP